MPERTNIVVSGYFIKCSGVAENPQLLNPLGDKPVEASVTVYSNGARQVGCVCLAKDGMCQAVLQKQQFSRQLALCPHLYPVSQKIGTEQLQTEDS